MADRLFSWKAPKETTTSISQQNPTPPGAESPLLAEEAPAAVLENLPPTITPPPPLPASSEEEWELLSDRASSSTTSSHILVPRTTAGSVRSIASLDGSHHWITCNSSIHSNSQRSSYKLQRTHSSSTIDSLDNATATATTTTTLGGTTTTTGSSSSGGVLGVDYVEHVVIPGKDTIQGICLAYKISSTQLRQANHFSGHSLLLAPQKIGHSAVETGAGVLLLALIILESSTTTGHRRQRLQGEISVERTSRFDRDRGQGVLGIGRLGPEGCARVGQGRSRVGKTRKNRRRVVVV